MYLFESLARLSLLLSASLAALPVTVPSDFPAQTPEPSGIVWAPSLARYLIVSDDVQVPGTHRKHLPWLFAMTPSGALESSPVAIDGLEELNDPESICAGPDGTFFIATSHSPNTHGRIPPSRRKLLHVALAGRHLRILGQLDLTEVQGESRAALEQVAQASGLSTVDIEAVTYQADALYIGLKAPLSRNGQASILRLASPVGAFRSGSIAPGALSLWRSVRLCLPETNPALCQGVADMTFLPSGTMLLVANAPKGMPSDGGGALWRLEPGKAPEMLQHFSDLKPEGLTLSADGQSAVIVFDCDRQQPRWLSWPVPR